VFLLIGKDETEGPGVLGCCGAGAGNEMIRIADQGMGLSLRGKGVRGRRGPSQDIALDAESLEHI